MKDYKKEKKVLFKRRWRQLERSNEAKRKARAQQVFCTARSPTLQRLCYYGSFSTPLSLNSNAIKMIKKAEQEKALFYLENKTGLGIFSSRLICSKISTSNYSAAGRIEKP